MLKNITYGFVLLTAMFFVNGVVFAEDPPMLDQVYKAAQAGKLYEAQRLMDKVLTEHPKSAEAHFLEAEILAKQGQMGKAEAELSKAEYLMPDLSFAKPQAVQDLKERIAVAHRVSQSHASNVQAGADKGLPWGLIILVVAPPGFGVFAIIIFILRAKYFA